MDQPVYITEKLEGSHWSVTWLAEGDQMIVSQRNHAIRPKGDGEHTWHKVARRENYADKLRQIGAERQAKAVTVRGELLGPGIQSNYYKLPDHCVYIFEIEINGTPLPAADFLQLASTYELPVAPVLGVDVLLREWLGEKTLKQASDGNSTLAALPREGIVIKPMVESQDMRLGRLMLKQRSPEYLAKSEY